MQNNPTRNLPVALTGGALGTLVMSAVMLGARALHLMGEPPPKKITRLALEAVSLPAPARRGLPLGLATVASHFGYGVTMAAGYALGLRALRARPASFEVATTRGALFGAALWAASYAGWVPAVGILPRPSRDRSDRQLVMVLAHLVYGAVVGAVTR